MAIRKVVFNLHLYTALVVGVVVAILGVTGSIMAFETDLDRLFNRGLFKVQPGTQPLPIPVLEKAVKDAYPSQKSFTLFVPPRTDQAYYTQSRNLQVFVDGYTGKIIGTRSVPTTLMRIHQLHLRLLMGEPGALIVTITGFVIAWLVISGIYLWWPQRRLKIKTRASFLRVTLDLHNVVGIYSAVFLLVLSLTGIFIHFDHDIEGRINTATHGVTPLRNLPSTVQKDLKPISPDQVIEIAKTALPDATPFIVTAPVGVKGSYMIVMTFTEDQAGHSWVNIDQYSGKVLFVESSRTAPTGTKTLIANRAIHTGDIFGYPTKILMSLASLAIVVQVITGYFLWLKKLRFRQPQRARNITDTLTGAASRR